MKLVPVAAVAAVACSIVFQIQSAHAQRDVSARAVMLNLNNEPVGEAIFTQTLSGVVIRVEVKGLEPGWHGIHIHESGNCLPPFASAGGHLNPAQEAHGFSSQGLHAGDLPNIHVSENGSAAASFFNGRIALTDNTAEEGVLGGALSAVQRLAGAAAHNLFDHDGASLIIHARPDDYSTSPDGATGDRIACGVIERQ
jgi:Cu-Zn family superoxide dismutase